MTTVLRIEDVTKRFGGIVALDEFSARVADGEITGIIGPNGAGKTTLFNVITGVLAPEGGSIYFRDDDITALAPHEICHAGISRTFQTPKPIRALTVEGNLRVARAYGAGGSAGTDGPAMDEILELFSLGERRGASPEDLPLVQQKFVDVARALATGPGLILLDEIMAGLNPTEKATVIGRIEEIHDEFGVVFLVIEHDLDAIRSISDTVIAMNEGRELVVGTPDSVMKNETVREAYIGA